VDTFRLGIRTGVTTVPRNRIAAFVDAPAFTAAIVGVILVNAVVLALGTYPTLDDRYGTLLHRTSDVCFTIFVVELMLRIASYGRRPWNFFRSGWNVFDWIVILAVFVPGVRENATLLRIARLARLLRVVRLLPDVRVLLLGVVRSIPPLASVAGLTAALLFVYGMVGWLMFADDIPGHWGTIGRAMLTLFVMLTLENFPTYMDEGMDVHPWSWVYFVSFVLVAAFIVLNVLIGIVLNSMEEARESERRQAIRNRIGSRDNIVVDPDASAPVVERIAVLRAALDELELELSVGSVERRHEHAPPMDAAPPQSAS
jgi:voltage-gated sodium channel